MKIKDRIGIDVDDVVVNFMKWFLDYSNLNLGTNYTLDQITNYHLWELGIHKSKEESIKIVNDFQDSAHFNKIDFVEGSKEGIERISKFNDIYFVTSRPEKLKRKTEDFFYSNFPKNGYKFSFSGEIHGGKTKAEICKELNLKIMIEDNPSYALSCAKEGIETFLLSKYWNKDYVEHKNLVKVKDWEELIDKLKV